MGAPKPRNICTHKQLIIIYTQSVNAFTEVFPTNKYVKGKVVLVLN
jgi:hypothetical protein